VPDELAATQFIFRPLHSFHATPDSGGTDREKQRAVAIEHFNPNVRSVLVRVVPNLYGLGDPLRPAPGAGRVVREGLEYRPVIAPPCATTRRDRGRAVPPQYSRFSRRFVAPCCMALLRESAPSQLLLLLPRASYNKPGGCVNE
jgi:hypothetical protein